MRTVMRYYGGKWKIAPWIISHFPVHKFYCEPYAGAASVLLRKKPVFGEIYNDLDGNIVNVFRVLRDAEKAKELIRLLELTPYSRDEFMESYKPSENEIECARRTIVRSFMGFGSDSATRKHISGFRSCNNAGNSYHTVSWEKYPKNLRYTVKRFRKVVVENLPALDVIEKYDHDQMLFYIDPPYLQSERFMKSGDRNYAHDMSEGDHIELAEKLKTIKGMAIVSGYHSELYEDLYKGWGQAETKTQGHAGPGTYSKENTEVIWISPNIKVESQIDLMSGC